MWGNIFHIIAGICLPSTSTWHLSLYFFYPSYFFFMAIKASMQKSVRLQQLHPSASYLWWCGVVWCGDGLSAVRPVFIPPLHAQLACVYFSWYLTAARLVTSRKCNRGNGETLSAAMTLKTQRWHKKKNENENKKSLNINVLVCFPQKPGGPSSCAGQS